MGHATEQKTNEPPWLVRRLIDRCLDWVIGAVLGQIGIVATVFGLILTGAVRVTASDPIMVVLVSAAAVVGSLTLTILIARWFLFRVFEFLSVLIQGIGAVGTSLVEVKPGGFSVDFSPETFEAEKARLEALMAAPQQEADQEEPQPTWGGLLRLRLFIIVGHILLWLFTPGRLKRRISQTRKQMQDQAASASGPSATAK